MLKISFTNAEVSDHGYGLDVNGKSLEDIISSENPEESTEDKKDDKPDGEKDKGGEKDYGF